MSNGGSDKTIRVVYDVSGLGDLQKAYQVIQKLQEQLQALMKQQVEAGRAGDAYTRQVQAANRIVEASYEAHQKVATAVRAETAAKKEQATATTAAIRSASEWLTQLRQQGTTLEQARAQLESVRIALADLQVATGLSTGEVQRQRAEYQQQSAALTVYIQQLRQAEQAERTLERAQASTGRALEVNAKKLVLWALGMRTVFRLVMELRRAIVDFGRDILTMAGYMEDAERAGRELRGVLLAIFRPETTEGVREFNTAWESLREELIRVAAATRLIAIATREALQYIGEILGLRSDLLDWQRVWRTVLEINIPAIVDIAELAESTGHLDDAITDIRAGMDAWMKQYSELEDDAKDAFDAQREALEELLEAQRDVAERIAELRRDYRQDLIDAEIDYTRDLVDAHIEAQRDLEEAEIDYHRRREEAALQLSRRLEEAELDYQRGVERATRSHQLRMLRIEWEYREQLIRIEETYRESLYDAIAARDATAALRAMRRRERDVQRAQRDHEREEQEAQASYQNQLVDLQDSLRAQQEEARRAYQQRLIDLQRYLQQEQEDIARALQQEEEDLARSLAQQQDDLLRHLEWRIEAVQYDHIIWLHQDAKFFTNREELLRAHLRNWALILQSQGTWYQSWSFPAATGPQPGFAEGGAMIANRPTSILVGEGRYPELVIAQPLPPSPAAGSSMSHLVSGTMRHQVSGAIEGLMSGSEGRLGNAISAAVREAFREILR